MPCFSSNLPPVGGLLILDATLVVIEIAISRTSLAGRRGYLIVFQIILVVKIFLVTHVLLVIIIIFSKKTLPQFFLMPSIHFSPKA